MRIANRTLWLACCLLAGLSVPGRGADAPLSPELENEQIYGINKEAPHATLMPYANLYQALAGKRRESAYARSLNGLWKFHWVKRPEQRPVDFYKPDFDISQWAETPVPGNWQIQGYGTPYYRNAGYIFKADPPHVLSEPPRNYTAYDERNPVGSYRRDFEVPADWNGRRIFITFDGVDSAFFLWINGQQVGYSVDSRQPAEFDITKYVKPGKNVLAAEVYRFSAGSYLEDQDMWRLSGIYRNVTLWSAPQIHIRDFFIKTDLDAKYQDATLDLTAMVKNYGEKPAAATRLAMRLYDKDGKPVEGVQATGDVPALNPGEEQEIHLTAQVANPAKWTAETPNLYTTVLTLGEAQQPGEIISTRTGFRKVEIKGKLFTINGVPVKLKGADRHENWPDTGHYVTEERMIKDLELLKGCNSNHVRTCHYGDDPRWYELCDEYGIYLVAEANVECHGLYGKLDRDPRWQKAIVDRNIASVQRDKNHPSVIIWSFGNECGGGDNFRAVHDAVRKLDPTRPTHYEPFGIGDNNPCEIDSNMYPSVDFIKHIGESNRQKPYYMCEYAHAMSNSMGAIGDYNDVIDSYEGLMGGAIWEWQDQALWNRRDPSHPYLVYGGGFGEFPNDGVFILKGVVFADRTPTPKYPEVKKAYQWIGFKDLGGGKIELKNKYAFTNLNQFKPVWTLMSDGTPIGGGGLLPSIDLAPFTTTTIQLPLGDYDQKPGAHIYARLAFQLKQDELWGHAGDDVASEQFALPNKAKIQPAELAAQPALQVGEQDGQIVISGQTFKAAFDKADGSLEQYTVGGKDLIRAGGNLRLYAYRAPHLNDDLWTAGGWRAAGLGEMTFKAGKIETVKAANGAVQVRASVTATGKNDHGFNQAVVYTVFGDGTIAAANTVMPVGRRLVLPRIGVRLALDKSLSKFSYFGRGPLENYADRKRGSDIGYYTSKVVDQVTPYVVPMECGNHEDVNWAAVTNPDTGTGLMVVADGAPLQASALPWSDQQLEKEKFPKDLPASDATWFCISARTLGVGSAGCGPAPLEQYRVYSDPISFSYLLRPLTAEVKDLPALARTPAPARVAPVTVERAKDGKVTLTSTTPGAKISYAIEGAEPAAYAAPFDFKQEGRLTVKAEAAGALPFEGTVALGKFVDHSRWKIAGASSFQKGNNEDPQNAIDGDPGTIWHSKWNPTVARPPHWLVVDLGAAMKLKGVIYQGRSGQENGRIRDYEIYLSDDGKTWGQPAAKGRFRNNADQQTVRLAQPVTARYLKIVALSEAKGQPFASIAELDVIPAQ